MSLEVLPGFTLEGQPAGWDTVSGMGADRGVRAQCGPIRLQGPPEKGLRPCGPPQALCMPGMLARKKDLQSCNFSIMQKMLF